MGCTSSSSSSSPIENNNQKQSIPSEISIPKNEQNEKQIINKNKEEKENLAKVNSTREEEKVTPSIQNSQSQLQSPTTQTQSQVQQQQPTPKSPSMNQSTNSSPIQSQSQSVPSPISLPVLSPPITPTEPLKTPISPVVTAKSPSITSKIENKLESVEIPQLTLPEKITLINTKLPNSEPFTFPQNNNSNNDNNNNNDNDTSDDGSELSRDSFEGNLVVNESSLNTHRSEDTSTVTSSTHGPEKVQIISSKEEFIYEYERWQPFVLWGQTNPGHMLPSDPGIYSDIEGTRFGDNPEDVSPAHPKWWHIITPYEPAEKVEDPWEYSVDFKNYEWHSTKQKKSFVRRRKLRRVVGDSRHHQSSLPQGITSFSSNTSMDRININPPPPTVKGNMKKSGGKLQSFNDRYFVLESNSNGSYLIYYLKYTDSPPYGNNERDRMNLKNCQMITSPEGHIVLTSKKGKIYVLDLNDHPDKEKWTQALQDHINYANSST